MFTMCFMITLVSAYLSKQFPLPDFTGSFGRDSHLTLGFWTCLLLTSLGRWDFLSVFVLRQGHCPSSEPGVQGTAGWEELDESAGLIPCLSKGLGWTLWLPGFSGQAYQMVRTG